MPKRDELVYVFTASERLFDSGKGLLGSAIFRLNKKLDYGTVYLNALAIRPEAQGRSLSTILVGSIFKFLPQVKRITLDTGYNNHIYFLSSTIAQHFPLHFKHVIGSVFAALSMNCMSSSSVFCGKIASAWARIFLAAKY